jgi:thioredoxin reductase (NADPH)
MVTADEVGQVAVFAALSLEDRERVARAAADITLAPGEYAAHEGSEQALFAVLAGRIEPVKSVDGVARVVGERLPGDIFGEVPIVLGTVFPSASGRRSGRGSCASSRRVPRRGVRASRRRQGGRPAREPQDRRPARAPGHRRRASSAARDRDRAPLGRVVHGAAPLPRPQPDHVQWLTPDAPDAAQVWGGPVPADQDCPTIRVVNGKTVVRPQLRRVAELLGVATEAAAAEYDAVIVGAGPAGLAAAVYGASEGLRTIVIEREAPGGQAGTSSRIENYLGFPSGVSGDELASRALQQAWRLGAEVLVTRTITRIDAATRQVHLDGGDVLRAKTIILACGVAWRHLAIEGFERLAGRGSSTARRAARPRTPTASTSTSWVPATRRGRRPCSSPSTRAA